MSERNWIDVSDWNLRSMKPGASETGASWGAVRTDESGAVTHVAGRTFEGKKLEHPEDPVTGEKGPGRLVPVAVHEDPPTRERLLEAGYVDRADFPLDEGDLANEISSQPLALVPQDGKQIRGERKVTPAGGERKVAPTTHVEAHPRGVQVEPDGAPVAPDGGEMGAPVDLGAAAQAQAEAVASVDEAEGYTSPFQEGPPPGTPASDPRHNPPEGAPHGDEVEDAVKSGKAEVIG